MSNNPRYRLLCTDEMLCGAGGEFKDDVASWMCEGLYQECRRNAATHGCGQSVTGGDSTGVRAPEGACCARSIDASSGQSWYSMQLNGGAVGTCTPLPPAGEGPPPECEEGHYLYTCISPVECQEDPVTDTCRPPEDCIALYDRCLATPGNRCNTFDDTQGHTWYLITFYRDGRPVGVAHCDPPKSLRIGKRLGKRS